MVELLAFEQHKKYNIKIRNLISLSRFVKYKQANVDINLDGEIKDHYYYFIMFPALELE